MKNHNKIYIAILCVLTVILLTKSLFLDNYKAVGDEVDFYNEVSQIIEEKYDGGVYDWLVGVRIVKMKVMTEDEKKLTDDEGNTYYATGKYKARVRKYVLGILPFAEEWILDIEE